jgi:hypothetical protein
MLLNIFGGENFKLAFKTLRKISQTIKTRLKSNFGNIPSLFMPAGYP